MRSLTVCTQALLAAALIGILPAAAQVAVPEARAGRSVAEGSRPDRGGEKDNAELRRDFDRSWFGGEPTPEYLDAKKELARQELARWGYTFPGYKGELPAIPSASSAWVNLGPKTSTFSVYSGEAPTFPDVDSGRLSVLGVLTHPSNPQILYIGTSGGGVYKCTNADLASSSDWTWTPITDNIPTATSTGNVSVGAIAMHPTDPETLYLALGDQVDATGRGIYRSTNGGTTWSELGTVGTTTRVMSLLALDSNNILVGGNAGLWRSNNGGTSFTNISLGSSSTGSIWSVQRVGTSTSNLVATLQNSSGNGSFWYSTNGGTSWNPSTLDSAATGQNPGRVTVRGTPGSGTVVYAIAENNTTGLFAKGVFKSTNGGANWTFLPAPTTTGGLFQPYNNSGDGDQAFYNHCLAVDPTDPAKLFVGTNLTLYRSMDGGATWAQMTSWNSTNLPYAHADFHTSAWSQSGPRTLFLGNDGGICVVRDPYRATPPFTADPNVFAAVDLTFVDNRRNRGLVSQLIYHVGSTLASTPADSKYRITLGLQDLSSRVRVDEGTGLQNSGTWNDYAGTGDGFGTVISPVNGDRMMVSSYYTRPRRSMDGGATWATFSSGISGAGSGSTAPFHTNLRLGLADATGNTVYTATNLVLYKVTDWTAVSWTPVPMSGFGGTLIRNFNTSASNPNALVISANSGNVWVTYNGGTTWTNPAGGDITGGTLNLSYVWFDTANDQTIYAASVGLTTTNHHLWKSVNGGGSFVAIDGPGNGFPYGIPVHVVQNDPSNSNRLLAGTDFGVYTSADGGSTWVRYGTGLPLVATRDLYVAPDATFVRAGTYGRGLWEISGGVPPAGPIITTQPASQTATVGSAAVFTVVATGSGTLSYQWQKNSVAISGANGSSYTTPALTTGDNGSIFRVAVTDTAGTTLSTGAVLTVTSAGGGGCSTNLVQNPGFEAGDTGLWVTSSTLSDFIIDASNTPVNAHSGSWYAWLCGYGAVTTETLYQQISIPADAASATLNFWLRIATAETSLATAYDTLKVQVRSSSGAVLGTLATYSNLNAAAYAQKSFDLLAYKGQTVRIYFEGSEDFSNFTSFFLDDFDLNYSTPGAAAPIITTPPASQAVGVGQPASFTVVASGTPTPTYQWRKGLVAIPGATTASYSIPSTVLSDSGSYDVVVGNCAGVATSSAATLTVSVITVSVAPSGAQAILVGGARSFTATVAGTSNTAVNWSASIGSLNSTTANTVTFTAPATVGTGTITATSAADASKSVSITINVKSRDLVGDGSTDVLDLGLILKAYTGAGVLGAPNFNAAADLDGDGDVDDDDINLFLSGF